MIRLDTHVIAWLFAGEVDRLSPAARDIIDGEESAISPIAGQELRLVSKDATTRANLPSAVW